MELAFNVELEINGVEQLLTNSTEVFLYPGPKRRNAARLVQGNPCSTGSANAESL